MAKLSAKRQPTQVKVLQSMQATHSMADWQNALGIARRTGLSKPSVVAAVTLLVQRGYVTHTSYIGGMKPYQTRHHGYVLTREGLAAEVTDA